MERWVGGACKTDKITDIHFINRSAVTHLSADLVSPTSTLLQLQAVLQLKVDLDITGDHWDCFFQESPDGYKLD